MMIYIKNWIGCWETVLILIRVLDRSFFNMSFGDNNTKKLDGKTQNDADLNDLTSNHSTHQFQMHSTLDSNNDTSTQCKSGFPIGNFAPPGQLPTGFDPNSPVHGVDKNGSLVMRGNRSMGPQKDPSFKGDVDMMVAKGIIKPPPHFNDKTSNHYPSPGHHDIGYPPRFDNDFK